MTPFGNINGISKITDIRYLFNQQVHLSTSSEVAEHCFVYSLSDRADHGLQKKCDHSHEKVCLQCENLKEVLEVIATAVEKTPFTNEDDRDEAIYLTRTATLAIQSWKCHLLRSAHQDQARLDVIEVLDTNTILIVNDWAMKFLPQRYRESQSDWFGKRGISWHISVVYRRVEGTLQRQGFIHIIQSCNQDSSAVISIMQHVLLTLKQEHPEINTAYFRQDNAGCYHSARTVIACQQMSANTGITIKRIDFSDPQGGKGAADRLAATCKAHIRAFINEGHDVLNSTDLRDALLSHGGLEAVRVAVVDAMSELRESTQTIIGISKLNNFEFGVNSITCWRAYGIGCGKTVNLHTGKPTADKRISY